MSGGIISRIDAAKSLAESLNSKLQTNITAIDNVHTNLLQLEAILNDLDSLNGSTSTSNSNSNTDDPRKKRKTAPLSAQEELWFPVTIEKRDSLIQAVQNASKSLMSMRTKYDEMVEKADATLTNAATFSTKMNGSEITHKRFRDDDAMDTDPIAKFIQRSLK